MKRSSLSDLSADPVDVLVVGGGIYGLMAARDAALRGLSTILIEREDFGAVTSHNSLKIMHGGIRYVQHLDFRRLRASAAERAFWQKAAPDLIRPLEFVIPLFGHGVRGPEAFAAAAALYRTAAAGVRGPDYGGAGTIGAEETRRRMGDLAPEGLTGGGIWQDGQIIDANRLHLACLRAALEAGARAANHLEVVCLERSGTAVTGAKVRDRIDGSEGHIRARVTLCCAGSGTPALVDAVIPGASGFPSFARATNIVIDRPAGRHAVGVVSRARSDAVVERGGRMYFLTPWQGRTIIGTHESSAPGGEASNPGDVSAFLHDLSAVSPALDLSPDRILWHYQGLIPADVDDRLGGPRRQTRGTLIDHARSDGVTGLISVTGVKYTTARLIAERALDQTTLQIGRGGSGMASRTERLPDVGPATFDPDDDQELTGRIRTAFASEMAQTLADVLIRRTTLAETGRLRGSAGQTLLDRAARIAAQERGWSADRRDAERAAVNTAGPG